MRNKNKNLFHKLTYSDLIIAMSHLRYKWQNVESMYFQPKVNELPLYTSI